MSPLGCREARRTVNASVLQEFVVGRGCIETASLCRIIDAKVVATSGNGLAHSSGARLVVKNTTDERLQDATITDGDTLDQRRLKP